MRITERPVRAAALLGQLALAGLAMLAIAAEMRVAAHGIALDLPRRWEAHLYRLPGGDPLLHEASFPLPATDGDFGSGATAQMPAHWELSWRSRNTGPGRA